MRIRVCVDEYELHRNSKSRINEVKASLKDVKKPKPETMQALKENLDCRQEGFDHKFFDGVGGGDQVNQIVGLPRSRFQKEAQMSVGGGKAPAEPTKKRPNEEEDDSQTAPASKKLKDANSIVNKLRLKLIDTLAEIEKSSKSVLDQESDMMKVVPADEQRTADYSPLITTLKIRLAALKLACDESADVSKVFSSIDLVGEMEGRAPEESLRKMRPQNAISLLAQLLKK